MKVSDSGRNDRPVKNSEVGSGKFLIHAAKSEIMTYYPAGSTDERATREGGDTEQTRPEHGSRPETVWQGELEW